MKLESEDCTNKALKAADITKSELEECIRKSYISLNETPNPKLDDNTILMA